ncbi:octopamine receptor Oamb isoform X2 [Contarinia nasturtii]|uniref:octopamine receptor Oamb isoform X2 n=1 Tax=Contarinia nasturtii TaxID=265458 RepID=UPI0012D4C330|nr:octopamine receptor Oamb isoform X2 [Contarinia nasturtii]
MSNCTDIDSVKWTEPGNLVSLACLAFINVLVIVGNCLVIAAVFCSHKLRSVTNFFIVSLAVADLLVGIAVLPFSATWEVFKVWIFGDLWCSIWLAVDVWMCTASILNLCAISLDRYVAVTRPVTYPSIMSTKRAKLLVAGVWVLSFVICLPQLVGLTQNHKVQTSLSVYYQYENHTLLSMTTETPAQQQKPCKWTCELTNDRGYVVYSALGSFYIPMFVMLFFYWRIYRAAVRTTRAINQGFKTTKGSSKQNRFEETRLTLRIHRGRRSNSVPRISPPLTGHHLKPSKSIGTTSLERRRECLAKSRTDDIKAECTANDIAITSKSPILHMMQITLNRKENMESFLCNNKTANETNQADTKAVDGSKTIKGVGRRIFKVQAKRFRMETKAAKTLALIVGGFILCWLPFFTMYMIRAFCQLCIEPLLFSILFWLGYCNSAINPLIYALFSKDFRIAFKTILYKCLCFHCCKRDANANDCANNKGMFQHSNAGDTSSR